MPRWSLQDLKEYERKRQAGAGRLPSAQPERAVCNEPMATSPRKEESSRHYVIRITGFRKRILDPDNFSGGCKYVIDGLRYAGLIPDDTPEAIILETGQVKVKEAGDERTEIVIEKL